MQPDDLALALRKLAIAARSALVSSSRSAGDPRRRFRRIGLSAALALR
jgi:hypothetical protein